jgi:hypothetical protein
MKLKVLWNYEMILEP